MKVTFIRPNIYDSHSLAAMEVLCFAFLKGVTPPDVETVFYDERLGPIPYDEPTDLVAITVETFTARRAYQIAIQYRKRGVKVVMGGFHPTFMPAEASCFADAVVQGDAEISWPQILCDAKAGCLKPFYNQEGFPPLTGMRADRSIFCSKRYVPMTLVQYSRGCKFNCNFCSIHAFYGTSMRQRPVHELVAEIEQLGARHVLFVDDNIFVNKDKAKELFRALIPLNITWSCQVAIEIARDKEVLDLMERSGCQGALIGFESLNPKILKEMNKGWNLKWIDYDTSIKRLKDAGIMIYGTFVFGYDSDTPDVFDEAVEFAIRHKFAYAGFNLLMPTPGSRMYDDLRQQNRMIYERWWLDPRFRYGEAVFHPRSMTAEEFTAGGYRARTAFSTGSSIFSRLFDRQTNAASPYRMWSYFFGNFLLRKEVHEKQGRALGSEFEEDPYAIASDIPIEAYRDHIRETNRHA